MHRNTTISRFSFRALAALAGAIALLVSCSSGEKTGPDLQPGYPDVIDIRKIPSDIRNVDAFGFSDMGAWHAYSLPHPDSTGFHGGFSGPLLMKNSGRWLGNKSSQLILTGPDGADIRWITDSTRLHYYPGILSQSLNSGQLKMERSLVFADSRTALITGTITNVSDTAQAFSWQLASHLFRDEPEGAEEGNYGSAHQDLTVTKKEKRVIVYLDDRSLFCITLPDGRFRLSPGSAGFTISGSDTVILKPGESFSLNVTESYFFGSQEFQENFGLTETYLGDPAAVLDANAARWNGYLGKIFDNGNAWLDSAKYRTLAVKCVETLISNWRSPAGSLKHNGLFPSTAYQGFYGFWSWDSWKHASALALFNDSLAKESIRSMFDYQNDRGMIADCIYHDPSENNWRDTKPPLAAWAVWNIFGKTGDTAFVSEMWPALMKYHQWWYKYRDIDGDSLCEYGSADGTLIAAKWESGMDNAVRFDESGIERNADGEWSLDQESVDLNTFLQQEKHYLSQLDMVINPGREAGNLQAEAAILAKKIPGYFWSEESGYFMDRSIPDGRLVSHYGPEGWLPLWAGLADERQAREVAAVMMDEKRFGTLVPLPTLDASDTGFDPLEGYWRGPVWLDQVYFGITGLKRYGYDREASALTYKLFANSEGMLSDLPLRENYHPLTGRGLNAEHFSWSAAHLLLLLTE